MSTEKIPVNVDLDTAEPEKISVDAVQHISAEPDLRSAFAARRPVESRPYTLAAKPTLRETLDRNNAAFARQAMRTITELLDSGRLDRADNELRQQLWDLIATIQLRVPRPEE